jgi:hypothetical protein
LSTYTLLEFWEKKILEEKKKKKKKTVGEKKKKKTWEVIFEKLSFNEGAMLVREKKKKK